MGHKQQTLGITFCRASKVVLPPAPPATDAQLSLTYPLKHDSKDIYV